MGITYRAMDEGLLREPWKTQRQLHDHTPVWTAHELNLNVSVFGPLYLAPSSSLHHELTDYELVFWSCCLQFVSLLPSEPAAPQMDQT